MTVHILKKHGSGAEKEPLDPLSYADLWGTMTKMVEDEELEDLPPEDDEQVVTLRAAMLVFFIVCIILLVVYLFVSLMLMYGSYKGSRWFLLPWLVSTLLFIIAYIVGMCLSTVLFGISVLSLAFLVIAIVESAIALYLWTCVIALFQFLANRENANQAWELKPRFNTTYKGVPQSER